MANGKLLLVLAVCLCAKSVMAHDYYEDDKCTPWYGHGGCGAKCIAPWGKCCAVEKELCLPKCKHYGGYCVKDVDFCTTEIVETCTEEPKKVCEPVCKPVTVQVCKDVPVKKCGEGPKVCYNDKVCAKVPKKQCKTVPKCSKKEVCEGGRGKAGGYAGGYGSPSYAKNDASAGTKKYGGAHGASSSKAGGSYSASTGSYAAASSGGCKYVDVCNDEKVCETVFEQKCETKHVCKPGKKTCKTVHVKKCEDITKNDCSEKKCSVVYENVCGKKEIEVCKDVVTCGGVKCGYGYKCNPACCPTKKVPVCLDI